MKAKKITVVIIWENGSKQELEVGEPEISMNHHPALMPGPDNDYLLESESIDIAITKVYNPPVKL